MQRIDGNVGASITAPSIDGYSFAAWIACISSGWVGRN
nr:MAG TPA: hypothetical protein [Caudoviricetes sp.]